jgi:histidinol dehydrogenase
MAITLRQSDPDFEQRFAAFLSTKREVSADVEAVVRDIIARVRAESDAALIDYTRRFDRADLETLGIAVSRGDIDAAYTQADPATVDALKLARDRIRSHHQRQMPQDDRYTDAIGVELGSRWTAVESVGLYVPGGTASYPSSVLMNAMPAAVAGVGRIVMVVPAAGGTMPMSLQPSVRCSARSAST